MGQVSQMKWNDLVSKEYGYVDRCGSLRLQVLLTFNLKEGDDCEEPPAKMARMRDLTEYSDFVITTPGGKENEHKVIDSFD